MNARHVLAYALAGSIFVACSDRPEAVSASEQSAVTPAPPATSPKPPEPPPEPVATPKPAAATLDEIAMAANDFGMPSTRVESALDVRRWIQDGGNLERLEPAAGSRFVIVEFPDARSPSNQIFYDSRQVSLVIGGNTIPVFAATTAGANAPSMGRTEDGRRVFQREVYASHYAPTPDLPFAVAFEVPSNAASGTLALGSRDSALFW